MNEDIKVIFIIPKTCRDENDCSEEMQLAYVACEQHSGGGLQVQWVQENQWSKFDGLTKRDVFVLTEFGGNLYEKLRATKCLLVGPRCLSCCLTEGTAIPSGPEPVFTVAMRGLVITASGLTKQDKENIKKKVHWMGGIYNTVLTDDTTHLVSDTVLSDKYVKSIEKGIPVMSQTWIPAVWEASLHMNINGSSAQFESHKLPPFFNLQVTTSGISKKDKQMIMKLVNEYGGTFSGAFQSETTDIVILNKDGVGSEKYKAALEYGKACVLPAWVKDSAMKGVALPLQRYRVAGATTSSPLSLTRVPDMSLNFSRITNIKPANNFVDESRATDVTTMSGKIKMSQEKRTSESSLEKEVEVAFENFDMTTLKKVGPIFDGFCMCVLSSSSRVRERCMTMISRCGGVRSDSCDERVTHALCTAVPRQLSTARLVSPLWLLACVRAGRTLPEDPYTIEPTPGTPAKSNPRVEAASPMSKRNLQLLRRPLQLPPPTSTSPIAEQEPRDELVNHYLSQHLPEEPQQPKTPEPPAQEVTRVEPDITDDCDEPTEEIEQIFRGIKIEVQGLDEEAICELGAEISSAGGTLCAAGAGGTHVMVPLDYDAGELLTAGAHAVTVFWLKDCLSQQELLPIQYYHRPVKLPALDPENLPLKGVVASLSTYSGVERAFLDELAKLLGATTQLRFCRRNTANALASTHLICPTPSGDKYAGAVKWGLPAVTAHWLTACCEQGSRVGEGLYLVGGTVAPPSPQKSSPIKKSAEGQLTKEDQEKTELSKDKENAMLPPTDCNVPRRGSTAKDDTPKHDKKAVEEMSPASRYIALARQGLLGDSQETPTRHEQGKQENIHTPSLEDALSTPNLSALSPTTRRRLQCVRRGEMPSDPIRTPTDPFDKNPSTPDSAFGANLRPGSSRLSPEARKRLWTVVQDLPGKQTVTQDKHTPLSEIRNRFLKQFNGDAPTPPAEFHAAPRKLHLQEQADTPPAKMARTSVDQSPGSAMKTFNRSPSPEANIETTGNISSNISSATNVPPVVDAQLLRLNAALSNRSTSQRIKRTRDSLHVAMPATESEPAPTSQPNTVGWDDGAPASLPADTHTTPRTTPPHNKRFMLSSNVDNREEIIEMIAYLGGEVCDGAELDPEATHLLCAAPGRSEKMLGSIAAGRWVLHPAYVARSRLHGTFLPEEQYEWGNPTASTLPQLTSAEAALARAAHRWRVRRDSGLAGPFRGCTALLHVPPPRHQLLARLVRAGGGHVAAHTPPYSDESITVCFADVKRYPLSPRDASWFKSHRIPVCPPVLLSSYLTDDTIPDPREHCLPEYRPE